MTLDEAIRHAENIADSYKDTEPNCKCAEEHRQLAEWLKELKAYRETYPYGVDRFNGADTSQEERSK